MIIAPLSCNTLAKMTAGLCDNLLLAAYLSATCPVVVAPAMDEDMWHHATTKKNLAFLHSLDNKVIAVRNGELASGLFGEGRMAEPEEILVFIKEHFFRGKSLKDVRALVTAGPTFESIDPVRFVGNHSSGKMGIAIAEALYFEGADVTVVAGPNVVPSIYEGISFRNITTAAQMFIECTQLFDDIQIAVMAAAVADYTPATVAAEKIKKLDTNFNLPLTKTKDILFELGQRKKKGQFLVGFALETQNEKANALKKLSAKNTDLLVLNSLRDEGAGFGKDTNKVTIFDNQGHEYPFAVKEKSEVAKDIVDIIIQNFYGKA
jgi:phosphopantothenoylcysteine decarboxylase/phosphopantothenate--cysteine ligase